MGRFISADDRVIDNGNVFAYCSNNPVSNFDPTGHWNISSWFKDTWKSVKSWWNSKPKKSKYTIPSSSGMLSSISDSALGSTAEKLNKIKGKAKFQINNGYVEPIPLGGKDIMKYPSAIKNVNRVSAGLTVATTAMDLGNTWTDNNDNTNGDRVVKSGIQVTGVALSIGTSYVAFAAFNAWNPAGWAMFAVGAVAVTAVIIGSNVAIGKGQQKLYNELEIN